MQPPRESLPSPREHEDIRARVNAQIPSWYNPYVHFAIPMLFGLGVIAASIYSIENLRAIELLTIPIVFLVSNATEWRAHRDMLHKRHWLAPVLYDRHTPIHHMLFLTDDMEVRHPREWRMVLIPPYGIMLICLLNVPIAYGLTYLGSANVAALYLATAIGYVVAYEALHLAFHMPKDSWVGRMGLIRVLRRHHSIHHDPRLMQKWNFNVVFPLWDLVRRTYVSAEQREAKIRPSVRARAEAET